MLRSHPSLAAPWLLNKVLAANGSSGRIVEVEAYGGSDDPASHAFRGWSKRNRSMFEIPGTLYMYFIYGVHHCVNVVAHDHDTGGAVLIRALAPLDGLDSMRTRRGLDRPSSLGSGPGKLAQALGLTVADDGADLLGSSSPVRLVDDGVEPPADPEVAPRVGIRLNAGIAWRWSVRNDPNVSAGRPKTRQGR